LAAVYSANANFLSSISAGVAETVRKAATQTYRGFRQGKPPGRRASRHRLVIVAAVEASGAGKNPSSTRANCAASGVNAAGEVVAKGTPGAKLIPLTVKKYSNSLAITLLQAHRPKKYRANYKVEHTGADGGPIEYLANKTT